jgi:hypothetical protein
MDTAHRSPRVTRPSIPTYGVPETVEGALPWAWAQEHLATGDTYWVGTTRPDGRPHLMPIWAAWCDGRLWLEGGATTRRARNIEANPAITVGLQLPGYGAVIVEGTAERLLLSDTALAARLVEGYAKYAVPPSSYVADPANWSSPEGGIWAVTPHVVFGWSTFPADATRWIFDRG